MEMKQYVKINAPATSANMGPGFDCLGMALDIWNTIEVEVGRQGIEISGHGQDTLPRDSSNLIYTSIAALYSEIDEPLPSIHIRCHNEIHLGRGLGSSSAAVVGGLVAANELCGNPVTPERILELAVRIEGHPDNVAAALLGGFQIVVQDQDDIVTSPVPIPDGLHAVIYIPDMEMPTEQARNLLEPMVDRGDAVFNIGRAALLVRAFATGDLKLLPVATDDRLHQPARQSIFRPMKNIFRGALEAGALGVFLSGAGSSVLALSMGKEFTIGYEMADAADKSGITGEVKITTPSALGTHAVTE